MEIVRLEVRQRRSQPSRAAADLLHACFSVCSVEKAGWYVSNAGNGFVCETGALQKVRSCSKQPQPVWVLFFKQLK